MGKTLKSPLLLSTRPKHRRGAHESNPFASNDDPPDGSTTKLDGNSFDDALRNVVDKPPPSPDTNNNDDPDGIDPDGIDDAPPSSDTEDDDATTLGQQDGWQPGSGEETEDDELVVVPTKQDAKEDQPFYDQSDNEGTSVKLAGPYRDTQVHSSDDDETSGEGNVPPSSTKVKISTGKSKPATIQRKRTNPKGAAKSKPAPTNKKKKAKKAVTPTPQRPGTAISQGTRGNKDQRRQEATNKLMESKQQQLVQGLSNTVKKQAVTIDRLRQERNELRDDLAEWKDKAQDEEAQNEDLQAQMDRLEVDYQNLQAQTGQSSGPSSSNHKGLGLKDFTCETKLNLLWKGLNTGQVAQCKRLVRKHFRTHKFVNETTIVKLGEKVMNEMELPILLHNPGESKKEAKEVEVRRQAWFNVWMKVICFFVNDARSYTQGCLKEVMLGYLKDQLPEGAKEPCKLPPVEDFEAVAKRDFSSAQNPDLSDEEKAKRLKYLEGLFDLYVDKMITAVANPKLWTMGVRSNERISTSLLPNSTTKLRVPASTEAMVLLYYKNNKVKWEAMHKFLHVDKGHVTEMPKYCSKKAPEENLDFKCPYTDSAVGQNKWGGWTKKGKNEFKRLQVLVIEVRENEELCEEVEQACVERLYQLNKKVLEKGKGDKKRKHDDISDDDEEECEMIEED